MTGEKREVWARDPETRKLFQELDENGAWSRSSTCSRAIRKTRWDSCRACFRAFRRTCGTSTAP